MIHTIAGLIKNVDHVCTVDSCIFDISIVFYLALHPIVTTFLNLFCDWFNFITSTVLHSRRTRPFFRTSLIRISVDPDSEYGRPTNEFKQRAPRVMPEMPDRWLPTLVNMMFCRKH